MNKESEKQKWNDIFLEDCAVYDKKIAEEYTTLQERIATLEKENAELKEKRGQDCDSSWYEGFNCSEKERLKQLANIKEIMNIAIEGIKYWGIVGGTERPFEKQAEKLFNLFLDRAEQFLSEVEK